MAADPDNAATAHRFDYDGSGTIEAAEMMKLGKAFKQLQSSNKGAKASGGIKWTEAQNQRLVADMDASGDGLIDEDEFIDYCDEFLPKEAEAFKHVTDLWEDFGHKLSMGEIHEDDSQAPESEAHRNWRIEFGRRLHRSLLQSSSTHSEISAALTRFREQSAQITRASEEVSQLWREACDNPDCTPKELYLRKVPVMAVVEVLNGRLEDAKEQETFGEIAKTEKALDALTEAWGSTTIQNYGAFLALLKDESWHELLPNDSAAWLDDVITLAANDKAEADGVSQCGSRQIPLMDLEQEEEPVLSPATLSQLLEVIRAEICLLHSGRASATTKLAIGRTYTEDQDAPVLEMEAFLHGLQVSPWCHFLPAQKAIIEPEVEALYTKYVEDYNQKFATWSYRKTRLTEVFQAFDQNQSGTIEVGEFFAMGVEWQRRQVDTAYERQKARKRKVNWSVEQNQKLVDAMDTSGDGLVDLAEFIKYCDAYMPNVGQGFNDIMTMWIDVGLRSAENGQMRVARLEKLFHVFDLNMSGNIDLSELQQIGQTAKGRSTTASMMSHKLRPPSLTWTEAQNAAMCAAMDVNGDGKVSKGDFVAYCCELFPEDEVQFIALCDHFTEIGIEAERCREMLSKRSANAARHARTNPDNLPKYGLATKLYHMQRNRDQEEEMKRMVRSQLEDRKQRSEADYRSRGRLVRRREQQVKQRALELARTWREEHCAEQSSTSDYERDQAEQEFWEQMLQRAQQDESSMAAMGATT